ncbi:MAG TPA: LuxR C-terminal-related transcriptional regulator [Oligoflexus sp.]|uniref:helix-turn-helix transcriptional regulator n=1 Tax=Oligoflexus sp. TaxID=1971216 RepID=UPI002D7EB28E|nr:LuxR C-terminal-related transcriptional regulator [Oligoflexus sp.]HET9240777.1 LuxR C-terminal-related transcriptional regulator [Oligoflexus sp.]
MFDENHTGRQNWILTELLMIIIVLLIFDSWYDFKAGVDTAHLVMEFTCGILGLLAIFIIWHRRIVPLEGALRSTEKDRRALEKELEGFRKSIAPYAANIRQEVERQFSTWNLTAAEKETAFLLLKGLSLKDIAQVRGVSEKTVKQHNLTIYQKSGLAGRAELSAFFLQDLLTMPDPEAKSG